MIGTNPFDGIEIKAHSWLGCFKEEDFLFHDQPQWAVGWCLKGADICGMGFGDVLSRMNFIVHDD